MDTDPMPTTDEELRLARLMEEANVNYAQRDEFRHDPPRAIALLEHALSRRKVEKPAAYALARFRRGEWPGRTNGRDRSRPLGAYEIASRFIHGYGWDDSYARREMDEELEAIYARRGERLRDVDRERLIAAWDAEMLRRYPPEAHTAEEWAREAEVELHPDQLGML